MFSTFSGGDITSCSNLRQSSFQLERLKQIYEGSETDGAPQSITFSICHFPLVLTILVAGIF